MPKRIQRKRTKGWHKPFRAINCTRPGKFGNPFQVSVYGRTEALGLFRAMLPVPELRALHGYPSDLYIREKLHGADLMCYCSLDEDCHVDDLLRIANS
jgi:hypothetical protein